MKLENIQYLQSHGLVAAVRRLIAAVLLLALTATPALSATAAGTAQPAAQGPTRITAQRMTYAQSENAAIFEHDVYVKRADLELWSDKLVATLQPTGGAASASPDGGLGSSQIERRVATGKVRFIYAGKYNGTCGKATYISSQDVIILEDKPVVAQEGSTLQGEVIRLYLKDNRSEVQGARGRPVEMLFTPKEGKR